MPDTTASTVGSSSPAATNAGTLKCSNSLVNPVTLVLKITNDSRIIHESFS